MNRKEVTHGIYRDGPKIYVDTRIFMILSVVNYHNIGTGGGYEVTFTVHNDPNRYVHIFPYTNTPTIFSDGAFSFYLMKKAAWEPLDEFYKVHMAQSNTILKIEVDPKIKQFLQGKFII